MVELPKTFEVRQVALGGGDCFFDSIAQGLEQLKPEFNITVKSLRELCKRFAQIQSGDDQSSWLKEALKSKEEPLDNYIQRIEFTANDIYQKLEAKNIMKLTSPIWGRIEIEGRIICAEYKVKLHVIKSCVVEGKEVWIHQIVDSKGTPQSVDSVDYDNEENTVHIIDKGGLHFQPVLKVKKKNKPQHNEQLANDDHSHYSTESKGNQEPQDEQQQASYLKNPDAGKTEGHSYQVKLAMWFLLSGKEKLEKKEIKSFYLATDMLIEAQKFGHIVFKYHQEGCRSKVTFLEAKHKEKEICKINNNNNNNNTNNSEEIGSVKVFDLVNAWNAYRVINKRFSRKKMIDNRIFGADSSSVECTFIFFTNTGPNIGYKSIHKKTMDPEDTLYFNKTNNNHYYTLTPCDEIQRVTLKCNGLSKQDELHQFFSNKNELDSFLCKLKLFLGQPNEKELGKIIKQKIQSRYSVRECDVDQVFASAQHKMQEWHRKKGRSEFLTSKNRFFEDAARVSITFDVKKPVALFTGRIEQLNNLHSILQNAGEAVISQIASVTGLGGVGKSELARKYISECSKEYDDNVIWINAENYLTIADSFGRVAEEKLGISTLDEQGKKREIRFIVEDVYQYFTKMHRKSLFVFDNAEKHKSYGEKDEGIDRFLPSGRNKPHVLITSRDQEWREIKALALDVFTPEEAVEFIKKALKDVVNLEDEEESNVIKKLAAELQYLPLALTQAVAYIQMENQALTNSLESEKDKFTVSRYLELYKVNVRELLSRGSSEILDRYTRTVMTTWEITIEKIKKKGPQGGGRALEMLNVIAYLAPDKVPVDVIFSKLVNDVEERHCAIELLDQYSMVSLAGGKLNIHRLVQQVTRIELEGQGKHQAIMQKTFKLLGESFPYNNRKLVDLSNKKRILPHLEMFLSHVDHLETKKPEDKEKKEKCYLRYLLTWMADGYTDVGDPKRRKELLKRVLPIFQNYSGPNSPEVCQTIVHLGNAYGTLGKHKKKKELVESALKILENNYAPNHFFQIARAKVNLGNAHGALGERDKQKELLEEALKILEGHFGPDHLEVAAALVNLSNAYGAFGEHHKELKLLKRALEIEEKHYEPSHYEIANTLVNLATAFRALGNYEMEKEPLERALKIYEEHYGSDHFHVARALVNLGNTYGALGDHRKRLELLKRALVINQDHYGSDHFEIGKTLVALGNAYGAFGDYKKEKKVLTRALKIFEHQYEPNYDEIAIVLLNLGITYEALGDSPKGKEFLERALEINENRYERNHIRVAIVLMNLGNIHMVLGNPQRGKEFLERALDINEDYYGRTHIEVAKTLVNLANAYGVLGEPSKQKELLERALEIHQKNQGPNSFEIGIMLSNLGIAYGNLGDYEKGREFLERSLEINEAHYGSNHFEVAVVLKSLGNIYGALGDNMKKSELLDRALKIQENYYGQNHVNIANILENLGKTLGVLGDHQKEKELLERALQIYEKHYGLKHLVVARTLEYLSTVCRILGDHHKEAEFLEQTLVINEELCGPEHFSVAKILLNLYTAYAALRNSHKSRQLLDRVLPILEKSCGPEYPFVKTLQQQLLHMNLCIAAEEGNFSRLKDLIDGQADNLIEGSINFALVPALKGNHVEIIRYILDKIREKDPQHFYEHINIKSANGDTLLMCATKNGQNEVIEVLLEHGADLNAQNSEGEVALHLAAKSGNPKSVQLLLNKQADCNIKDNNGKTPLDVTQEKLANDLENNNFKTIEQMLRAIG